MLRWFYHAIAESPEDTTEFLAPASLGREGFVHASFLPDIQESARLYVGDAARARYLRMDPRRLDAPVTFAATPRGVMPHIHGPIAREAIVADLSNDELASSPDAITGTRVAFVAFAGMTLLDLIGVWDPVSRVASMGFDPTLQCEVVAFREPVVFERSGMRLEVARIAPDLCEYDVLIIPGGPATRSLETDDDMIAWLRRFSPNRWLVTVCTGALLAARMGRLRGRFATTHASELARLSEFGALPERERVVEHGGLITSGGVTAGIDAGLHLVSRLCGGDVARKIAVQMEHQWVAARVAP